MSPETFAEILTLCDAAAPSEQGLRDLPARTTITMYLSRGGVGLTVASIEALALKGSVVHARTTKGDLYLVELQDVFAANVEGKAQPKATRRAGFGS
jgi:hypothetical protein